MERAKRQSVAERKVTLFSRIAPAAAYKTSAEKRPSKKKKFKLDVMVVCVYLYYKPCGIFNIIFLRRK